MVDDTESGKKTDKHGELIKELMEVYAVCMLFVRRCSRDHRLRVGSERHLRTSSRMCPAAPSAPLRDATLEAAGVICAEADTDFSPYANTGFLLSAVIFLLNLRAKAQPPCSHPRVLLSRLHPPQLLHATSGQGDRLDCYHGQEQPSQPLFLRRWRSGSCRRVTPDSEH
jgi:hypothetical protein